MDSSSEHAFGQQRKKDLLTRFRVDAQSQQFRADIQLEGIFLSCFFQITISTDANEHRRIEFPGYYQRL